MDEVFILGEDGCPRCKGKDKAELFAGEVRPFTITWQTPGRKMWMWGDRLLDGKRTGFGKWEAQPERHGGRHQHGPERHRDLRLALRPGCPLAPYFAVEGFRVLYAPWRETDVAMSELDLVRSVRSQADSRSRAPHVGRSANYLGRRLGVYQGVLRRAAGGVDDQRGGIGGELQGAVPADPAAAPELG